MIRINNNNNNKGGNMTHAIERNFDSNFSRGNPMEDKIEKFWISNDVKKIGGLRIYIDDQQPKLNSGGTFSIGSDAYAFSVIEVQENWNNKGFDIITITKDTNKGISGDYYSQNVVYEYTTNYEGRKTHLKSFDFTMSDGRKAKYYKEVRFNEKTKRFNLTDGCGFYHFGNKRTSFDPHF